MWWRFSCTMLPSHDLEGLEASETTRSTTKGLGASVYDHVSPHQLWFEASWCHHKQVHWIDSCLSSNMIKKKLKNKNEDLVANGMKDYQLYNDHISGGFEDSWCHHKQVHWIDSCLSSNMIKKKTKDVDLANGMKDHQLYNDHISGGSKIYFGNSQ